MKSKIILILIISLLCVVPVFADPILNPSVDSQPILCRNAFTGWICDMIKPGPVGSQGSQGPQGEIGPQGPAGIGGGQVLYFHHDPVESPAGYEGLQIIPAGQSEEDEAITINSGSGLKVIDPYITLSTYPGTTTLPAGLWRFRTFHYVSVPTGTTTFVFTVYNYTSTGVKTKLFETVSEDINSLTPIEYLTPYVQQQDYTIKNTDRLVINVSVNTTHASNVVAHFVYEGSLHTSHVQTPLPLSYTIPPMINESYAYLPGREGGQTLYGGATTGDLNLNGNIIGDGQIKFNASTGNVVFNNQDMDINRWPYVGGIFNFEGRNSDNPSVYINNSAPLSTGLYAIGTYEGIISFAVDDLNNPYTGGLAALDAECYKSSNIGVCVGAYGYAEGGNSAISIMGDGNSEFYGQLSSYGSEYFDDLGDGSVESVGGYLTTVSDEKAKTSITLYTSNITKLLKVVPIQYYFNEKSKLDTTKQHTGFSAQNLLSAIPEAVSVKKDYVKSVKKTTKGIEHIIIPVLNPDGTQSETYSISDRAIIAVLVNSVKEQQVKLDKQDSDLKALSLKLDAQAKDIEILKSKVK